jgi:hypothetical protein
MRAAGEEIFAILLMLGAAGAVIAFLDWIGLSEAIREFVDKFGVKAREYRRNHVADADNTPWGEVVTLPNDFRGMKARAEMAGRGSGACEREPSVIKQSHNQVPASHSGTGE